MTVYVDSLVEYPLGTVKGAERVKYWCHMWSDTDLRELHIMAHNIGMKRKWFQKKPEHRFQHYDLSKTRRAMAVKLGAVEVDCVTKEMFAKVILLPEEQKGNMSFKANF